MLLFKARIRDDPSEAATLVTPVTGKHPVFSEANSGAEELGDENDEKVGTMWGDVV